MAVCYFAILLLFPEKRDVCGFALRLLRKVSREKHNWLKREMESYISAQPFFWKLALRECDFRAQKSSRCYYYFCFTGQCFGFLYSEKCTQLLDSLLHYKKKSQFCVLFLIYKCASPPPVKRGDWGTSWKFRFSSNQQFCWQTVLSY